MCVSPPGRFLRAECWRRSGGAWAICRQRTRPRRAVCTRYILLNCSVDLLGDLFMPPGNWQAEGLVAKMVSAGAALPEVALPEEDGALMLRCATWCVLGGGRGSVLLCGS
jgi:hypothetical protein